eukprot:9751150-Alexandrium_andersonii.AAC.1
MGLLTVVPIPVVLGATHSDAADAGDAGWMPACPRGAYPPFPAPAVPSPRASMPWLVGSVAVPWQGCLGAVPWRGCPP